MSTAINRDRGEGLRHANNMGNKKFIHQGLVVFLMLLPMAGCLQARPSVLFINVDDLNDWNGTLAGHPQAVTPNIDRVAAKGVTFTRAICSSPVCFPSRTSMFTGIHPVRSGAISNFNWGRPWRFYVADATTLPKFLENQGWKTFGGGKNFHGSNKPEFQHYFGLPREAKAINGTGYFRGPLGWAHAVNPVEEMPDYQVVSWGVEQIQKTSESAFFSIGIYKPHVPWTLPKSYFDRFPLEEFTPPVSPRDDLADLSGRLGLLAHNEAKFGKGFHDILEGDGQDKAWARAYLASVSFADEQLGRLLDAWEASPHSKDGYIVLWSDHGFMLGEKEGWGKFKPWFDASRVNLILSGPGVSRGKKCNRAVSLLDLYPTMLELLRLEAPPMQKLDGRSLVPLLKSPDAEWDHPVVMSHEEDGIRYDSVLTNRFRMTRLITGEAELYDLESDPNEWKNLAGQPEHAATIESLSRHLTFSIPQITEDGWLEAEDTPCQTSADHGRRGNFHYPRPNDGASGEGYLVAELRTGKRSYVEFVWQAEAGEYEVGALFGPVNETMKLSIKCAPVSDEAVQATAEAKMSTIGSPVYAIKKNRGFQELEFGILKVKRSGRHLLRFEQEGTEKAILRIDRLKLAKKK